LCLFYRMKPPPVPNFIYYPCGLRKPEYQSASHALLELKTQVSRSDAKHFSDLFTIFRCQNLPPNSVLEIEIIRLVCVPECQQGIRCKAQIKGTRLRAHGAGQTNSDQNDLVPCAVGPVPCAVFSA